MTKAIRVFDEDYRILKRITRRYDLSFADLVSGLLNLIPNWEEFIEEQWNICDYCGAANDIGEDDCMECGEEL